MTMFTKVDLIDAMQNALGYNLNYKYANALNVLQNSCSFEVKDIYNRCNINGKLDKSKLQNELLTINKVYS